MSDLQSRPAVARGGRGSAARGGRGGFSSRGARNASRSATNGDAKHDQETPTSLPTLEDQGEIADLNKAYGSKIETVKAIFSDWSEVDILYALKETDGDDAAAIDRILDGTISQWGEVSSQKKDRSKAKAKDTFTTTTGADVPTSNNRIARGGRPDAARGRGRATERGGRGATRGRSTVAVAPTNGARVKEHQPLSVPTDESNAWDTTKTNDDGGWASAAAATSWEPATSTDPVAPTATASANPPEPAKSAVIPQGTSKTWASMLRQSVVPKPAPMPPKESSAPQPDPILEPLPAADDPTPALAPETEPKPEPIAELSAEPQVEEAPVDDNMVVVPEVALPPSNDQLTKTNLEQVTDVSHPPVTDTAASEAADSWDPRAAAGSATATPISASQAQHQAPHKVAASGYAATAIKATERAPVPRGPAQAQRRFLDQQEAVRMPGAVNQQLERATVQFGAFNLNGTEEDIDGDREEPETRAQPPADSPVAQPRASLPPAPQPAPDAYTAQKPVSSIPPSTAPTGPQVPPSAPAAQQPVSQVATPQAPTHPAAQQYGGRYGQATSEPVFPQKPFDAYNQSGQPTAAQSHFDAFQGQQAQSQSQQPGGPYTSATEPFSNYYTSDQQTRAQFGSYYGGNYGQQQQQAGQGQESGLGSRAGFGGYGAAQGDLASQYPQSANQSRFGAAVAHDPSSGPSTPVPQATQGPPASQAHVGQHGAQFYGNQPYYAQQFSQYGGYPSGAYSYGGGGFGTGYGGKAGGTYGQPQHYQQQQPGYDHNSTAAAPGYPQSSLHRGDSGGAAGLGDYSRTGAQPGAQPGLGGAGFGGGIHDTFARGNSYGAQSGQGFNSASTQPGASDDLKPFGDGKTAGPTPAMGGGARPGSATNTGPSQSGIPPPQSQPGMGSYGGFNSHLQSHGLHGTQSGSAGYGMGAGSAQGQQNTPYSAYGGFGSGGGNSYYSGQQHQQRGWGGNYGGGNNYN